MLIGFFAVGKGEAQVRFDASAPNAVPLNERFQIVFTIQNGYGTDFSAPSFDGLNVLYPPSNAVSRMNINGKKSMSFTGTFMGKATGKVKIGAASVKVNGKTYRTAPITIEILPQDRPSSSSSSSSSKERRNDIFIRAIPSKTSVYEQEALLVTFKLYSTTMNIGFEEVKFPEFDGFIEENIPMKGSSIILEMEHYRGKNYYTAILKQTLIFPQRAGKLTIPSGEFKMLVTEEPSSTSEDSFFDFSVPVQYSLPISSPQLTIDAKPLPEPQPTSFSNAVGKFNIYWDLPQEDLKSNEVATMRLVLRGEGNLKLLSPPEIDFPESFEVYDPKSNTEIEASTTGVMGTKSFEYNVIPRNKGSFAIPSVEFLYFDPAQSRYITVKTKSLSLKISQGASEGKGRKSDVALLGNDIAYLQPYSSSPSSDWIRFLSSGYALLPHFALLLLGSGFAGVYVRYRRRRADVVGMRRREAPKRVKKQFRTMEEWAETQESDKVYEALPKVIYSYLADKYSLEQHALSQKGVCDRLLEKGVPETVVNSLIALLKKSEAASFSDKAHKPSANLLLEEAKEIINQLENARTRK